MKQLYLIRHSKAIPCECGVNDFKRPLAKRGIDDAKVISKHLRKTGVIPDILISSPADRALETAHIFALTFEYSIRQILLKEEIYEGGASDLCALLTQLDDHRDTAMLFGHEPALSSLAAQLLHDAKHLELHTTGVIGIEFDIANWRDMAAGTGRLLLFDFPAHVTPKARKKAKKALFTHISPSIEAILEEIVPGASHYMPKAVKKTSATLAKELTRVMPSSKVEDFARIHHRQPIDHLSENAHEQTEQEQ